MNTIDRLMLSIGVALVSGALVFGVMYVFPRLDNSISEKNVLCFKYGYYKGKSISGNIDSAWKADSAKFVSLLREAEND